MIYQETIHLETTGHGDVHDITEELSRAVGISSISTGLVNIHVIGSTGAIGTIEFEPGLQQDLPEMLDRLIPAGSHYEHEKAWHDGNAHSHLQATTLGSSLSVPIGDGAPILGTWQQVFFLECDIRPRSRRIVMTVTGE